jgi:hypothetical protein
VVLERLMLWTPGRRLGKKAALGKFQCTIDPRIFPKAETFPIDFSLLDNFFAPVTNVTRVTIGVMSRRPWSGISEARTACQGY